MLVLVLATPAAAQDVVGSGVAGGHAVDLLSNGTWREIERTDEGCLPIEGALSFCGDVNTWRPMVIGEFGADAFYQIGDEENAMLAYWAGTWPLPPEMSEAPDDLLAEGFMLAVLRESAGRDVPSNTIIESAPGQIDGRDATMVVAAMDPGGGQGVMVATPLLSETFTVLALTWRDDPTYHPRDLDFHREFLAEIRIDPDGE